MKHYSRSIICTAVLFLLILGSVPAVYGQKAARFKQVKQELSLVVTEISPVPGGNRAAWIELYNPHAIAVKSAGLTVVINDRFSYVLPGKSPVVPPGKFVLVRLDGKGENANTYKFTKGAMELHAPRNLTRAMNSRPGQIAVFHQARLKTLPKKITGFVAWGKPASKKSLTAQRNHIWKDNTYVPMAPNFGDHDPAASLKSGYTIGLYPGGKKDRPQDWVVYSSGESSPGKANPIPVPSMFTLANGAKIRVQDIAIGWVGHRKARAYKIQLAKDSSFRSMVDSKTLKSPFYRPARTLPAGTYYYRVKMIDTGGLESNWSQTMKVTGKELKMKPRANKEDGVIEEKMLPAMLHKYQRKDTGLLCLDGCASEEDASTVLHWDKAHPSVVPTSGDHGGMNCVRASISMMVSYYGKSLSQDRIAFFTEEERAGVGNGIPEGDMAHMVGMSFHAEETAALEWALNETVDFTDLPNPTFAQLKAWLDADRPIMTRTPGHLRTMNGYRIDDFGFYWVHILDPWSGPRWEEYGTWNTAARGTWVGPVSAPSAREDEASISTDSDGDLVMDFDEQFRFFTGLFDGDSDNDSVRDKNDIREYVFDASNNYSKRNADIDSDGKRKEKDPDNDGDTYNDGCEDTNFNGKYEPGLGETDNFAASGSVTCPEKPVHAIIVFDRSGSMRGVVSGTETKYDEAASAAVLFLDAWLANSPPANSKVGVAYYDCSSYFDTNAATDTTLELLTAAKRDKINDSFPVNQPGYGATSIGSGLVKAMEPQGFDIGSIPAGNQHRVVIVLTDGMENCGTRMDDPAVTSNLASGQVDGYVLGIGNETQIDMDKLNTLADILNHPPASFAKDMDAFELEKFFLQVLAETQGLEVSVDPQDSLTMGQSKQHTVTVSPGTKKVTFVVVWDSPGAAIDVTLKKGTTTITPTITKSNKKYRVLACSSPKPGTWTVTVKARAAKRISAPPPVDYSLMVLEKNSGISSHFTVAGHKYLAGEPLLLTAKLASKKTPTQNAMVRVEVTKPVKGLLSFVSKTKLRPIRTPVKALEKDIILTPLQKKHLQMARQKIRIPRAKVTVTLNDNGTNGDLVRGDGIYSAYFKETAADGLYSFRFITKIHPKRLLLQPTDRFGKFQKTVATREALKSILIKPKRKKLVPIRPINPRIKAKIKKKKTN